MTNTDFRSSGAEIILPDLILKGEVENFHLLSEEMPKKTVLATSSFYRAKEGKWDSVVKMRAGLALKMFECAKERGFDVVCVDEDSDEGWKNDAKKFSVQMYEPDFKTFGSGAHNMGRCRRQALNLASCLDDKEVVCWIDPEKWPAVGNTSKGSPIAFAASVIKEGLADWVIPRRFDNGKSYPATQQFLERGGNAIAQNLMLEYALRAGADEKEKDRLTGYLDHFFGLKLFRIEGNNVRYFNDYGEIAKEDSRFNDQWGSVHYAPFLAMFDGKRVVGTPVDYIHPCEQTLVEAENINYDMKRYEQGQKLTTTLALLINRKLEIKGITNLLPT